MLGLEVAPSSCRFMFISYGAADDSHTPDLASSPLEFVVQSRSTPDTPSLQKARTTQRATLRDPRMAPNSSSEDKNKEFLPFHSDQGATDLIALLSVTAAPRGGESKWVSSIAIHNELLRQGRKVRWLTFQSILMCILLPLSIAGPCVASMPLQLSVPHPPPPPPGLGLSRSDAL